MKITVNGKATEIAEGTDLHRLVYSVKSDRWSLTVLSEGDRVELVSFVGGG